MVNNGVFEHLVSLIDDTCLLVCLCEFNMLVKAALNHMLFLKRGPSHGQWEMQVWCSCHISCMLFILSIPLRGISLCTLNLPILTCVCWKP